MKEAWDAFVLAVDGRLAAAARRLNEMSRPVYLTVTAGISLGLGLLFFSPRLCVLQARLPGSFEWDRAITFLGQSSQPFAPPAEPAMRWRLLPPLVAHLLHLPGYWPLLIPWIGLVLLLLYLVRCLERLTANRLVAALAVALFGTSGSILFITMCHGINDGWWMLGLLTVACSPRDWPVIIACLLAPWVDERFLLALPLAFFCRAVLLPRLFSGRWLSIAGVGAAIGVYPVVRIFISRVYGDRGSADFAREAMALVPQYLPFAHLGWWMGFRAGWLLIVLLFWYVFMARGPRAFLLGLGATLAGWGVVTVLAADLTRSTNLLVPLFVAGTWAAVRSFDARRTARLLLALLAINLATPYEMVTYNKTLLLHALPFELVRLYKNWR